MYMKFEIFFQTKIRQFFKKTSNITLVISLRTKRTHLLWPVSIAIKVDLIAEK